jgi:hypothetical protein
MYFLINDSDKSVNYFSENPIPEFMVHTGITAMEKTVDHLPEGTELLHCFFDPDTDSIILDPRGPRTELTKDELKAIFEQQKLLQAAITQAQSEKWTRLTSALRVLFPDNAEIQSILSDGQVTQDELTQIESMLNSSANT